jgi:hypothetical protein
LVGSYRGVVSVGRGEAIEFELGVDYRDVHVRDLNGEIILQISITVLNSGEDII